VIDEPVANSDNPVAIVEEDNDSDEPDDVFDFSSFYRAPPVAIKNETNAKAPEPAQMFIKSYDMNGTVTLGFT